MKLFRPTDSGHSLMSPCWLAAVYILTGKAPSSIVMDWRAYRSKHPTNRWGQPVKRSSFHPNIYSGVYIKEIKYLLRGVAKVWVKWREKVISFIRTHKTGTYYLNLRGHCAILKNGRVYDNSDWGVAPSKWMWRDEIVESFSCIKSEMM